MIDVFVLGFLVLIAVAAIRQRDLFAVAMLFGVYSFMTAALFMDLDAVDVAFTEAAVGAGVTPGTGAGVAAGFGVGAGAAAVA